MKKINSVEDVIKILTKINKQTIKSYIADSGMGPKYMGKRGIQTSPDLNYYFGSKEIDTKKVEEVISLVEKFPNDFVWLKHSDYISNINGGKKDIYILMYVNMLFPGEIEEPKMIIAFSPAHFNNEKSITNKLKDLLNKKENQDRCKLFKVTAFDCDHPSSFDVMEISPVVVTIDKKTQDSVFKEISKYALK